MVRVASGYFFRVKNIYFLFFMIPTLSVGYKKCATRLKKNVSRLKKFVLGLKKFFQNLNFENLKISESQIFGYFEDFRRFCGF